MSKERTLEDWLADLVTWGSQIQEYTGAITRDEFLADRKTQLAVIKCIEIVGEASGRILRLRPDLAESNPKLELTEAYRMRNRLIHGYFGIDAVAVWNAATTDVPKLTLAAKSILKRSNV